MSKRRRILLNVLCVIAVLPIVTVLPCVVLVGWTQTRGDWNLSASNSSDEVLVEVYLGRSNAPYYSVRLAGHSIPHDVDRVSSEQIPLDVGTTTFFDGSPPPGRWTLLIDGAELDIMEAGIDIDGKPYSAAEERSTEPSDGH